MARTARKVTELLEESEEMEDAIRRVTAASEANGGTVAWEDVEDDLTSGQWGRMIETGVLSSAEGDGFELSDEEAVDAALDGDVDDAVDLSFDDIPEIDEETEEAATWTQWDKMAGATAVLIMIGYYYDPVQFAVGTTIDLVLGPLNAVLPFYLVILSVALVTGLYSSLLMANLMDHDKLGVYKDRMSAISEKRKEAKERGDDEAMERIQEKQMEMMGDQLGMMKTQFRPMVWVMLFTIPLFLWMWWLVANFEVGQAGMIMPFAGEITWNTSIVGPFRTWIVWYIACSIGFQQLIRKTLNIRTMPT